MTELLPSPSHFPSSPTTTSSPPTPSSISCALPLSPCSLADDADSTVTLCGTEEVQDKENQSRDQLSLLALLVTLLRKSLAACNRARGELFAMEIGAPTDVRHVAHVTFDRFNGFLGLPVEFEPEVPRRAPSASATVFGVSTESMQLSYDSRGNSVPTILLLMQSHLYAQGGLQAEGIFRINAENSQEEYVRDRLNNGSVPDGIDVHCLAGLIKAWLRELPTGVLDSLSPEQIIQCQNEEDCVELVRCLAPTEAALLDWSINLMADIVQQEHLNKMNAHNIAMVFAPNMTQMADPLTALMFAVRVMTFLKTLILRKLRERQDSSVEGTITCHTDPSDSDEHRDQSPLECCIHDVKSREEESRMESESNSCQKTDITDREDLNPLTLGTTEMLSGEVEMVGTTSLRANCDELDVAQSSNVNSRKMKQQGYVLEEKTRGITALSHMDSRTERIEAWR